MRVFISYAREDATVARTVAHLTAASGIEVWFDEQSAVPGRAWSTQLLDAIRSSTLVFALIGKSGGLNSVQLNELSQALAAGRRAVPIRMLPSARASESVPAGATRVIADDIDRVIARERSIEGGFELERADVARLTLLADSLAASSAPTAAIDLLDWLHDIERLSLGETDPATMTSRNNLAAAYQTAGRLHEALPLFERTLADRERLLGPEHPDTLTSRNNLAGAYQDAGRLAEALALSERTLADRERILGPDHPDTLTSRGNLRQRLRRCGPAWLE